MYIHTVCTITYMHTHAYIHIYMNQPIIVFIFNCTSTLLDLHSLKYIYIHTCIHTYIHSLKYTYIHTYMQTAVTSAWLIATTTSDWLPTRQLA